MLVVRLMGAWNTSYIYFEYSVKALLVATLGVVIMVCSSAEDRVNIFSDLAMMLEASRLQ